MGTGYSKKIRNVSYYGVRRADGGTFVNGYKSSFLSKSELDYYRKEGIIKGYTVVDYPRYRKEVEKVHD